MRPEQRWGLVFASLVVVVENVLQVAVGLLMLGEEVADRGRGGQPMLAGFGIRIIGDRLIKLNKDAADLADRVGPDAAGNCKSPDACLPSQRSKYKASGPLPRLKKSMFLVISST